MFRVTKRLLLFMLSTTILLGETGTAISTKNEPKSQMKNIKYNEQDQARLDSVKIFYKNIMRAGRSENNPTPLIADGINIKTEQPVEWIYPDGKSVKISNFANQQNFLRTLVTLFEVTGDLQYRETAHDTTKYFQDNYTSENGLYYWGGHRFVNLDTLKLEGPQDKNQVHELKNHFPYYAFLYEVNPKNTDNYVNAFWNAHIEDWETLDMGRHGKYDKKMNNNIFEEHKLVDIVDPKKLPELPQTQGLTFINAGSDLVYSAYIADNFKPDVKRVAWAKNLLKQYELAKNPKTGAPVYQFSSPKQRVQPPASDADTNSKYGDRAARQFGPEFGEIAKEGNALFKGNPKAIIVDNVLVVADIYKKTGDKDLKNWITSTLKSYYDIAYDKKTGEFKPVWNDGTDLTGYKLVRDGYYGKKGSELKRNKPATEEYAIALIRAYEMSKDKAFWDFAQAMAKNNFALGDIGTSTGGNINLNKTTKNASPYALLLMTDLYSITKNEKYLELGRVIGDNIVSTKFKNGYFVEESNYLNSRVDSVEAFALVTLDAALKGKFNSIPRYISNGGYIHGEHMEGDAVYDKSVIYKKTI